MAISFPLSSKTTALIVIDKQLSYTTDDATIARVLGHNGINPFDSLLPKIDPFIERCRLKGIDVVWTKMIEDTIQSPPNIRNKMLADESPTLSDPTSTRFEINGLQPTSSEKVITKSYYDAFAQTELDSYLKSKNIKNVILVGAYGSRCVLGTAFGANGHGYNLVVVTDLIGNPDRFADELKSVETIVNSTLGYALPEKLLNLE